MSHEVFEALRRIFSKSFDSVEACKRQQLDEELLDEMKVRLENSKFVPKIIISSQLLLFLNAAKNDVELAVRKIERYYELKHAMPEFFTTRDLESDEIQKCLDNLIFVDLPVSPDNCFTFCHKLRTFDPQSYNFDGACKTLIMKIEASSFKHGPRDGITYIDDLDGMSFLHMFRPRVSSIRKGMRFLQEGSPIELKAVHIMNCPSFISSVLSLVKPFINSEVLNRIHLHSPNVNFEQFHQKFGLEKSHLPSDYGGDLPSLEELHMKQREEFMEMREYFLVEEAQMKYEYDHLLAEVKKQQAAGTLPK